MGTKYCIYYYEIQTGCLLNKIEIPNSLNIIYNNETQKILIVSDKGLVFVYNLKNAQIEFEFNF